MFYIYKRLKYTCVFMYIYICRQIDSYYVYIYIYTKTNSMWGMKLCLDIYIFWLCTYLYVCMKLRLVVPFIQHRHMCSSIKKWTNRKSTFIFFKCLYTYFVSWQHCIQTHLCHDVYIYIHTKYILVNTYIILRSTGCKNFYTYVYIYIGLYLL